MPSTESQVREVLRAALQLGARADSLQRGSALLTSVPELDSMGVVTVITALEEALGIEFAEDELSADTFATFDSLVDLVEGKLSTV